MNTVLNQIILSFIDNKFIFSNTNNNRATKVNYSIKLLSDLNNTIQEGSVLTNNQEDYNYTHLSTPIQFQYWTDEEINPITLHFIPNKKVEYEVIQIYSNEIYLHKYNNANIARILLDNQIVYELNLSKINKQYDGYITDYKYTLDVLQDQYQYATVQYIYKNNPMEESDFEYEIIVKQELWICGNPIMINTIKEDFIVDNQDQIIYRNEDFAITQQQSHCRIYIQNPITLIINQSQQYINHIQYIPINTQIQFNDFQYTCLDKTNTDWQVKQNQMNICRLNIENCKFDGITLVDYFNQNYNNFEQIKDKLQIKCQNFQELQQQQIQQWKNNIIFMINDINDLPIYFNKQNFTIMNQLLDYEIKYYESYINIESNITQQIINEQNFQLNNLIYNQFTYFLNYNEDKIELYDHVSFNDINSDSYVYLSISNKLIKCTNFYIDHYENNYTCNGKQMEQEEIKFIQQQRQFDFILFYQEQQQQFIFKLTDEFIYKQAKKESPDYITTYIILGGIYAVIIIIYIIISILSGCGGIYICKQKIKKENL